MTIKLVRDELATAVKSYQNAILEAKPEDLEGEAIKALREKVEFLQAKFNALQAVNEIDLALNVQNNEATNIKKSAMYPSHEVADEQPYDHVKSLYVSQFSQDVAIDQAMQHCNGKAWKEIAYEQNRAFVKWLRVGADPFRITRKEMEVLRTPMIMPQDALNNLQYEQASVIENIKGMSIADYESGGITVPITVAAEIDRRASQLYPLYAMTTNKQVDGEGYRQVREKPYSTARGTSFGAITKGIGEQGYGADQTPELETYSIPLTTWGASVTFTNDLAASMPDLLNTVTTNLTSILAEGYQNGILFGSGGRVDFYGILPGKTNARTGTAAIQQVVTGSASTLGTDLDPFVEMVGKLRPYRGNVNSRAFIMSYSTWATIMQMKDLNGTPYLSPDVRMTLEQNQSIYGIPIIRDDNMPSISANTYPVLLVDMSSYWTIRPRVNAMTMNRITPATDSNLAKIDSNQWFLKVRTGGDCWWPQDFVALKVST